MTPYDPEAPKNDEKSVFGVIIHSFFVVPFLIAVFSVLLFAAVRILTAEQHTVYDYIEDVKTGGLTKRWQAAFELSKILANPKLVPQDERFTNEVIKAFDHAQHDDDRVRQYLALAMGRTGNPRFVEPLLNALKTEKEENLSSLIYSLGLLKDKRATPALQSYLNHQQPRVRLVAVIALGNIADPRSKETLKQALNDPEPNVRWEAAVALAKMGDLAGKDLLLKLLDRSYLKQFPEVDPEEEDHVLLVAIEAGAKLNDPELNQVIKNLGQTDQNMQVRRLALDNTK